MKAAPEIEVEMINLEEESNKIAQPVETEQFTLSQRFCEKKEEDREERSLPGQNSKTDNSFSELVKTSNMAKISSRNDE